MNKFLVAAGMISAIAAFNLAPQSAQARSCSSVMATARGVTQGIATTKAEWRLQRYVRRNLSGARMGHASTSNIARVGALETASAHPVNARR